VILMPIVYVTDMERSIRFYESLGFAPDEASRSAHWTELRAGDECAAAVGQRQRRQHAHGRRLACAVRAEQAEDLALAHGEGDAVQRLHVLVLLAETLRDDRVHAGDASRAR
jgi:hypothetical protein